MAYEDVVRLALERGFFAPSCEIYSDAPAGFWDYEPLGLSLRNRLVELWRREIVRRDGMIEIDGAQIMSKGVFAASRHLESFADPIVQCKQCKATIRADRFIEEKTGESVPERLPPTDLDTKISSLGLKCPHCSGGLGKVRMFNMMFGIGTGPYSEEAYLRPETCQTIFVDFPRLFKTMRLKLPVAVAQFGKSFRNEISPRQSLLRLREFYQAEIEVFFNPEGVDNFKKFDEFKDRILRLQTKDRLEELKFSEASDGGIFPNKLIPYYLALLENFYEKTGLDMNVTRFRVLDEKERAFYAKSAFDFEVKTSTGWLELVACNYRADIDLNGHSSASGADFTVLDDGKRVVPHIFELSMGIDRTFYCILEHSMKKEIDGREVLKLPPYLAPVQVGVFPLVSKDGLPEVARSVHSMLRLDFEAFYDESGSVGRRYRRQDEIGTPVCVTVDYQTPKDDTVTVRERDTMGQIRVKVGELRDYLLRIFRPS